MCGSLGGLPGELGRRVTVYSKLYTISGSGARDSGGISPRTLRRGFHTDAEIVPGPVCFVSLKSAPPTGMAAMIVSTADGRQLAWLYQSIAADGSQSVQSTRAAYPY